MACGARVTTAESVRLVGVLVRRRRRVREHVGPIDGPAERWAWEPVLSTARYPAHACPPCGRSFPGRARGTV